MAVGSRSRCPTLHRTLSLWHMPLAGGRLLPVLLVILALVPLGLLLPLLLLLLLLLQWLLALRRKRGLHLGRLEILRGRRSPCSRAG